MATLSEILSNAQGGDALNEFSHAFGLSPDQTQAAVAALLPAISLGLKQSTDTPEDLADLFALMGRRQDLFAMYDDPAAAFSPQGIEAGNAVLAKMFGSPDASRAIANQAQSFSGVTSSILKKLLPVLAGILISGMMRSGSGKAAPSAPAEPSPEQGSGGILGDILREIFTQGASPGTDGPASRTGSSPVPPIGDILEQAGKSSGGAVPKPKSAPRGHPLPMPSPAPGPESTDTGGQPIPGGDILTQILRELEKGIKEGRVKPVIVGPYEVNVSGTGGGSGSDQTQQAPGADIFGQILRDILGGGAQAPKQGVGAAVFGDMLESGREVDQDQIDSFQEVFDQFFGTRRR